MAMRKQHALVCCLCCTTDLGSTSVPCLIVRTLECCNVGFHLTVAGQTGTSLESLSIVLTVALANTGNAARLALVMTWCDLCMTKHTFTGSSIMPIRYLCFILFRVSFKSMCLAPVCI